MDTTYTMQDVLAITINMLQKIRLPVGETEAIETIKAAAGNLSECLEAMREAAKPEEKAEEEVTEDV